MVEDSDIVARYWVLVGGYYWLKCWLCWTLSCCRSVNEKGDNHHIFIHFSHSPKVSSSTGVRNTTTRLTSSFKNATAWNSQLGSSPIHSQLPITHELSHSSQSSALRAYERAQSPQVCFSHARTSHNAANSRPEYQGQPFRRIRALPSRFVCDKGACCLKSGRLPLTSADFVAFSRSLWRLLALDAYEKILDVAEEMRVDRHGVRRW